MCSGSKRKPFSLTNFVMEGGEFRNPNEKLFCNCSILLEVAASDDLISFRRAVQDEGFDVDETSFWYGRDIGLQKKKMMRFEERTPLAIAAMFGSTEVVKHILATGHVDVNRACGSDGATALHCAVAGGSASSPEIIKLLLDASADGDVVDAYGNRPSDLIASISKPDYNSRKKTIEMLLKGGSTVEEDWVSSEQNQQMPASQVLKDGSEKKEYPIDLTLPDIKNGIYGTDEFRMYTFKVKPCSRAYSHDWTECPFVHPGENARRRDPRKFHYSCVPCPEFRKGSCRQGDACEYAHGVFECWLHPAQYRTRLCKDETGCNRRVCFFAHKHEELRPLYASTGSAMPSPRSSSPNFSPLDMTTMTSTPPMSPSLASASPMLGSAWQNQPPTLQLPGSRLKTAVSARDIDLDLELLGLDLHHLHQQQQLMDEITNLSTQSNWTNALATASSGSSRTGDYNRFGGVKPTNLDDMFGSVDPSMLSQLQSLSLKAAATPPQLQSPTGIQIRQNMNQQQFTNLSSSPGRTSSSSMYGLDPSSAAAAAVAVMNSRSSAFAKRSQSFIDRGAAGGRLSGPVAPSTTSTTMNSSTLSNWGSPGGKLDWGFQGEEINKLRKSASFGFRSSNNNNNSAAMAAQTVDEPDVSWVQSLVKDVPPARMGRFGLEQQKYQQQYHLNSGGMEMLPSFVEQLYMEQEQMVA